jgi:Uma2 family endonuclease
MTQSIVKPSAQPIAAKVIAKPEIIWEKLPADFILPDDPVESIAQPLLAAALNDSLEIAHHLAPESMVASNMALVVKINQSTIVKAPDWFYVAKVNPVGKNVIRRSYSPHIDGEVPAIVMEFLSEEEGSEYSMRPTPPYGKMYFYEQILQVPIYVIFDPADGRLEIRTLDTSGKYELQPLDDYGKYYIDALELYLGTWHGKRLDQTFHWLRWWRGDDRLLYWGSEKAAQEELLRKDGEQRAEAHRKLAEIAQQRAEEQEQRAEIEKQRAEAEKQRADLAEQEILRLRQLLAHQEPSN